MMRPRTVTGPSGMMPEKSTADVRKGKPGSAHGAGSSGSCGGGEREFEEACHEVEGDGEPESCGWLVG